jgi:hypothetical protein
MKVTRIKFPIEEGSEHLIPSEILDFLSSSIVDGDLELDEYEYRSIKIQEIRFDSKLVEGNETYRVYNIDLGGDNKAIEKVETWFEQFNKPLH